MFHALQFISLQFRKKMVKWRQQHSFLVTQREWEGGDGVESNKKDSNWKYVEEEKEEYVDEIERRIERRPGVKSEPKECLPFPSLPTRYWF